MKLRYLLLALVLLAILAAGYGAWRLRGVAPVIAPPPEDIADLVSRNETDFPLTFPAGLSVSILAENLPGARALAIGPNDDVYVSLMREGRVVAIAHADGKETSRKTVASGLRNPHGLAFDPELPNVLYIAAENQIVKKDISLEGATLTRILSLPLGSRHVTRTIGFSPDGRLYISIGSSCDVCHEKDERHAAIWSLNKDGSDFRRVAHGLRNSVFFAWEPVAQELWATEMG